MKLKHIQAKEKCELENGITNWSYTFTIIHFKKVSHAGKYKAFCKYTADEQKAILLRISKLCDEQLIECSIHYETHQQMNKNCYHAHGTIYKVSNVKMRDIQLKLCSEIGIKEGSFWEYLYFVPTFNTEGWSTYCMKEVVIEENLKNLKESIKEDACIVKFDRYNQYLFI